MLYFPEEPDQTQNNHWATNKQTNKGFGQEKNKIFKSVYMSAYIIKMWLQL